MSKEIPEPSELIYAPSPSWAPLQIAAGLALVLFGLYSLWAFSIVGALVVLAGVRSWWKLSDAEVSHMRREQVLDTAVIPAEPIRRATGNDS